MRARNIKPSVFKNSELAHLGDTAYRLFTGLWCIADRSGRLKDDPEKIEAEIFPFKFQTVKTNDLLNALASGDDPFIIRYEIKGQKYIEIKHFSDHQHPHHKESASVIPPSEKRHLPRRVQAPTQTSASPSDVLIPDSGFLVTTTTTPPLPPKRGEDLVWFEKIWKAYPKERRVGRKAALRHFRASVKTLEDAKRCARALMEYQKSKTVTDGFIKNASTFFNQWEDYQTEEDLNDQRNSEGVSVSRTISRREGISQNGGGLVRGGALNFVGGRHLQEPSNATPGADQPGGVERDGDTLQTVRVGGALEAEADRGQTAPGGMHADDVPSSAESVG